jgi:hypothetical protein
VDLHRATSVRLNCWVNLNLRRNAPRHPTTVIFRHGPETATGVLPPSP